jgi:hypothetical protein
MAKAVAVEGDASPSSEQTKMVSPAMKGQWTAATLPSGVQSYDKLTVGKKKVISHVEWQFSFTGTDSNGKTVTGSDTVKLSATKGKLQGAENGVLLDQDSASGNPLYGNKISISASGKLKLG